MKRLEGLNNNQFPNSPTLSHKTTALHNSTTSLTVSTLQSKSKLAARTEEARFYLSQGNIAVSCLPVRDPSLNNGGQHQPNNSTPYRPTKQDDSVVPGLLNQHGQSSVRNSFTNKPQAPVRYTLGEDSRPAEPRAEEKSSYIIFNEHVIDERNEYC
ncbi:hypothetical protein Baya_10388 [Bagarius yarrelli]|uniref:Uncharacterized protein n=1 Tax=Bagarius yarrelli TaxID=175774 RepID=A0A556UYZ2_BAGYA|nr:hypothetical protein Baya_10388 [Bagarius yarrelli]